MKRNFASFVSWVNVVTFLAHRPHLESSSLPESRITVKDLIAEAALYFQSTLPTVTNSLSVEFNGSTTSQYNNPVPASKSVTYCQSAFSLLLRINVFRAFFMGSHWKNAKSEFMWNNNPTQEALQRFHTLAETQFGKLHFNFA